MPKQQTDAFRYKGEAELEKEPPIQWQKRALFASTLALTLAFVTPSLSDDAQARLESLAAKLRSVDAIRRVEILGIPPRILTRTRVTPDILERAYSYKLVIHDLRGSAYASNLAAAVAATTVQQTAEETDVRWAVFFFDADNRRIAAIYLDGSGRRGVVDTQAVTFGRGLAGWLNGNFSNVFK
jgi:hypothetical protein